MLRDDDSLNKVRPRLTTGLAVCVRKLGYGMGNEKGKWKRRDRNRYWGEGWVQILIFLRLFLNIGYSLLTSLLPLSYCQLPSVRWQDGTRFGSN